jgi:hypothetical protein
MFWVKEPGGWTTGNKRFGRPQYRSFYDRERGKLRVCAYEVSLETETDMQSVALWDVWGQRKGAIGV